jgi:DNA polymerase III alpha subunit (gram-positive type)
MLEDGQIYVVVDIETDGPVPELYSMLSLAAVATTEKEEIDSFYEKTLPLKGALQHPSAMAWWKTQPEAWQEVTTDAQSADKVLKDFSKWLNSLGKAPIFVAHPLAFDYPFITWYLWKFAGKNPFANIEGTPKALDLSSFIAGKFNLSLDSSKRTKLPKWMKDGMPEHSHNALEDAKGYGVILRNVLLKEV